jgi:uncharacterized protein (TIGR02246 family)
VSEIADLIEAWFAALRTKDAIQVTKLYAPDAVLLSTLRNRPRKTLTEIYDYFHNVFLPLSPVGKVVERYIRVFGEVAIDSGVYEFEVCKPTKDDPCPTRETKQLRYTFVYRRTVSGWLIVEHHSSKMPEDTIKQLRWLESEFADLKS